MDASKQNRSSCLGIALFIQLLLYLAQGMAASALYNAFGKQPIVFMAASAITVPFVFLVPLWVYCKKTGYRPFKNEFESSEKAFSQSRCNLHSVFVFLFAVCAVVSAVNVVGSLTDVVLSLFGVERASTLPANIGEFALTFVKTVIFAPILEELLFRGAIIHAFSDRSDRFKIIVSALLFALMHYSILTLPYAFAAGAVISFFAVKQKSLKYSIALHFCFNLTTFLFSVMAALLDSDVYSDVSMVSFCVFLAIAVCGGVRELLIARGKNREVKRGVAGAIAPEIMLYIIFAAVVSIINF